MAILPTSIDTNGKPYGVIEPGQLVANKWPMSVGPYSEIRVCFGMSFEDQFGNFNPPPSNSNSQAETYTPNNWKAAAVLGCSRGAPFASSTVSLGGVANSLLAVGNNYRSGFGSGPVGIGQPHTYNSNYGHYLGVYRDGTLVNGGYGASGYSSVYDSKGLILPRMETQLGIWGLSLKLISGSLEMRLTYSSARAQSDGLITIDQAALNAAVPTQSVYAGPVVTIPDWGDRLPTYVWLRNPFVTHKLRLYLVSLAGIV